MATRVAVFGGGIAGLTAAHELACRGFTVKLFEQPASSRELGGKARTQYWTSAFAGELPGEHGFRFFPAFYEVIIDTMRRIPLAPEGEDPKRALDEPRGESVLANLTPTQNAAIGRREA